jgi:glucokinase
MALVGADIGGTHITCAIVEHAGAQYHAGPPARRPVDSRAAAPAILDAWCAGVRAVSDPQQLTALGLAAPGPFDYARGVSLIQSGVKYDALYGLPLGAALRERLGLGPHVPIVFDNDANCFAYGEWLAGAARGARRVIGITLGTGLGAGFVADGAIQWSGPGVPRDAEVYWVPYRDATAEDYISTRGLQRLYAAWGGPANYDIAAMATDARAGDARAQRVFAELGTMIAEVLAPWLREFRAEMLVVGGAMARSFALFGPTLTRGLDATVAAAPAVLGETATLTGAAVLAHRAGCGRP